MTHPQEQSAGTFTSWLAQTRGAQATGEAADVPCGECTACCKSSYFIHIEPDEMAALAAIPAQLLFAAPGLPDGHVLMGYDEQGQCPMLKNNRCSIYAQRPKTCRSFDCRVFAATNVAAADDDESLIAKQVARWSFDVADAQEQRLQAALRAAAAFLRTRADLFPAGVIPRNSAQLAVLAIKVYPVFQAHQQLPADGERVTAVMRAIQSFEQESQLEDGYDSN